ncbi:hypothetical protein I79_025953 [Cricetulus griseus]|uniref:Uncharacterized protein n=1 Tax=Cricetulus griseus TaxID=10029 RepID=G3IPN4_CRIGR|nr:hypothetical protein I79_025953 [Cricetulus griseus]
MGRQRKESSCSLRVEENKSREVKKGCHQHQSTWHTWHTDRTHRLRQTRQLHTETYFTDILQTRPAIHRDPLKSYSAHRPTA